MSFFCNALPPTLSTRSTSHTHFETMGGAGRINMIPNNNNNIKSNNNCYYYNFRGAKIKYRCTWVKSLKSPMGENIEKYYITTYDLCSL